MSLADTVERLRMEYSAHVEYTFDGRARGRKLKCSFCNRQGIHEPFCLSLKVISQSWSVGLTGESGPCNRPYKYQIVLDEHVIEHMNKLKELTDDERLQFLRWVFNLC